jgi:hypothetical protein
MKKIGKAFFAIAALSVVVIAFIPGSKDVILQVIEDERIHNSLSGREGTEGPVLVVKIDDTTSARPQIGLDQADVIYIEQVEGGLTRLAAIFSTKIPTLIGPVRSARISDIDILAQYGRVVFAYSGAQSKMYPVILAANLNDYGAQRQSPTIYTRDPLRRGPTDMVLRADLLMEKVVADGREIATSTSVGWTFSDDIETGTALSSAKVSWPAAEYEVRWSSAQRRWLIFNDGIANMSASGIQHGASTFVIQLVKIVPSIYGDKFGGVTPLSETVGTGVGYILRDGKYIEGRWSRPDLLSGTSWSDLSGEEITFARGQVWIALTEKNPQLTLEFIP